MKITITAVLLVISMAFTATVNAQNKPDKIVGYYLTFDDETGAEKSQVQIYKDPNGKYYGKVVWLKEPLDKAGKPKVDDKNPDVKLQKRAIIGLEMLKGFKFDESENEWSEKNNFNTEQKFDIGASVCMDTALLLYVRSQI